MTIYNHITGVKYVLILQYVQGEICK